MTDGNVGSSQVVGGLCVGRSTKLRCTNNNEDNSFGVDTLLIPIQNGRFGNVEIDITGCKDSNINLENEDDPDATEYSSSFGGIVSRSDEVHGSNCSDVEVDFIYRGETEASMLFNGDGRLFPIRKGRLSAQRRRYVHSLLWRCKWNELRLLDLQSQARKYEKAHMSHSFLLSLVAFVRMILVQVSRRHLTFRDEDSLEQVFWRIKVLQSRLEI